MHETSQMIMARSLFQYPERISFVMKILQINAVHRTMSTGRNVYELNQYFTQQGHQTVAAYSVGTVEDPKTERLIGKKQGQKLHAFLSRFSGLQGYFSRHSTRDLLRFMDEYRPDAVILNNLHANYIHLPMLLHYLAKKDIPTVAVQHDCWMFTGKCCHFTVAGCYRWQESCGNCPAKKKYNKSWLFDRTAKMLADKKKYFQAIPRLGVVTVSDWLLQEAQKAPVFQNALLMQRIHNWINTETFSPRDGSAVRRELGLEDRKIILCVASGWKKEKGLDTVLELAGRLTDQEKILLVGRLPADLKLPEQILHIPATDNVEKLVALYSAADVFLQPSLEETFGKVSAEALACGTPVVCFNSTANPEVIGEGCGTVVEPGDLDGMLTAIRSHLQQGKEACSDRCRAFAEAHFEKNRNVDQYLQLINQLVHTTPKEPS